MPEGDTLFRTAAGLRPHLVGRKVTAARARRPGPQVERIIGTTIESVESQGKNLLIRFDNGLEIRTHLRMNGSWHRYRPGERWRRPEARARLVIEVPGAVAVCFDAPVVELFEQRAEGLHPGLNALGPDLLDPGFDAAAVDEAVRRLRDPARADDDDLGGAARPARARRDRQHLAERDALRRTHRSRSRPSRASTRNASAGSSRPPTACSWTARRSRPVGRRCASTAGPAGPALDAAR